MKYISLLIVLIITSSCTLSHTSRKEKGNKITEITLTPLDQRKEIQQAYQMSHQ